jgi:hypothetical protein
VEVVIIDQTIGTERLEVVEEAEAVEEAEEDHQDTATLTNAK